MDELSALKSHLTIAIGHLEQARECASKTAEVAPSASANIARDVIAALETELHQNYQPCHQFTRDDVLKWLRQHTPVA